MISKKVIRKISAFLIVFAVFIVGCTADYTKQIAGAEKLFYSGKYLEAARMLLPYVNKENEDHMWQVQNFVFFVIGN